MSREGRHKAAMLALRLSRTSLQEVFSSPQRRAVETARLIAGAASVSVRIDRRLEEFDFGEWTGRPVAELEADPRWQHFNRHRATAAAPGGERVADLRRRVAHALDAAFEGPSPLVVMVTHAEVIRTALLELLGRSPDDWHTLPVEPASVSVVRGRDRRRAEICAIGEPRPAAGLCRQPPGPS